MLGRQFGFNRDAARESTLTKFKDFPNQSSAKWCAISPKIYCPAMLPTSLVRLPTASQVFF
jgi:hypothetical protein